MGYRYNRPDINEEPPKPEDELMRFDVRNGAWMKLAFDCRYCMKDVNHPMWIFPRYPGDVAVARKSNGSPYYHFDDIAWPYETKPIIFHEEGYDKVTVALEDSQYAEYIEVEGSIDEINEPNIVRVRFHPNFPTFHDKPIETRFTVFVHGTEDDLINAVCHGILVILPGPNFPTDSVS